MIEFLVNCKYLKYQVQVSQSEKIRL